MNNKFSPAELAVIEITANELANLLNAQVVDITEDILRKIISRLEEGADATSKDYLAEAESMIKQWNYSWDEALGIVDIKFGYNPETGKWDGSYREKRLPVNDWIYIHGKVEPAYLNGDPLNGDPWNAWLKAFEIVTEEFFYNQELEDLSDAAGLAIFESEEAFMALDEGLEAGNLVSFIQDVPEDLSTLKEMYFAVKREEVYKLIDLQYKSNNNAHLVFCI